MAARSSNGGARRVAAARGAAAASPDLHRPPPPPPRLGHGQQQPSSRPAPRLNRAAPVSDNSVVAVHPAADCELVSRVATEVNNGLEVPPNNNSSEKQPVARVADTEVPTTNNSTQQLAPHVAVNIPSTIEDPNNSGPQLVTHVVDDTEVRNNSFELQLAPHEGIDIPTSVEVPNNSGLQLVSRVATEVTSGIEVPHNNSSGQQLVTHVASDTEVRNNSSELQLAPHEGIDIPTSVEVPNNSGPQDGSNDGDWKRAAWFGGAKCVAATLALVKKPPSSSEPVYPVAEAIIFTAGLLEILAALWVSRDARNRRTAKRMILYASFVSSILGLVLGFYTYKAKE